MPNHVINEIILHGVSLVDAAPKILNSEGKVDFGVLLPLPLNFWPGSVGRQHEKSFPGTHLAAATQTWGTKWNAYGNQGVMERDGSTVITFETASDHPRGWTCAVFNTFACKISVRWLSQGVGDGYGETYSADGGVMGGPEWSQRVIEEGSQEHRDLHKMLWGVEAFEEDEAEE